MFRVVPFRCHTFLDILETTKHNVFLTISYFCCNFSPQDISFYFCHMSAAKRLRAARSFCGCGAVHFFSERQLINWNSTDALFFALNQHILQNKGAVKHFNKTYCTSPAPLTFCFSHFLTFFKMCLQPPCR